MCKVESTKGQTENLVKSLLGVEATGVILSIPATNEFRFMAEQQFRLIQYFLIRQLNVT